MIISHHILIVNTAKYPLNYFGEHNIFSNAIENNMVKSLFKASGRYVTARAQCLRCRVKTHSFFKRATASQTVKVCSVCVFLRYDLS